MSLATTEHGTPEAVSGHGSSAHSAEGHGKKGLGNPVLGMLLFIVSEIMFFGGLFAAYFRVMRLMYAPSSLSQFDTAMSLMPCAMRLLIRSTSGLRQTWHPVNTGARSVIYSSVGSGGGTSQSGFSFLYLHTSSAHLPGPSGFVETSHGPIRQSTAPSL